MPESGLGVLLSQWVADSLRGGGFLTFLWTRPHLSYPSLGQSDQDNLKREGFSLP